MPRLFFGLWVPRVDLIGPLHRTADRIKRIHALSTVEHPTCPDCGSLMRTEDERERILRCSAPECGAQFQIIGDHDADYLADFAGDFARSRVSKHRSLARASMLCLYVICAVGLLASAVARSPLTLGIMLVFAIMLLPCAGWHSHRARALERELRRSTTAAGNPSGHADKARDEHGQEAR